MLAENQKSPVNMQVVTELRLVNDFPFSLPAEMLHQPASGRTNVVYNHHAVAVWV